MFDINTHIHTLLSEYIKVFPDEVDRYQLLQEQLERDEIISSRKNFTGHLTASAYIISGDMKKIAMIHNKNLNKWLAPGGHWEEGDNEMYNNARREAIEETGIQDIELFHWHKDHNYIPIDIDTHYIPENPKKQEHEHFHHDFRYIFMLHNMQTNINIQWEEVQGFQWISIAEQGKNFSGSSVIKKISHIL